MVKSIWKGGLTWPPSCKQVLSCLIFTVQSIVFYTLESSVVQSFILLPCYSILCMAVAVIALVCTAMDSTDQAAVATTEHLVLCRLCNSLVRISSKHCRFCERCVVGFDHCEWLNTCIGKANYCILMSLFSILSPPFKPPGVLPSTSLIHLENHDSNGVFP